jgi:hypothetical protein
LTTDLQASDALIPSITITYDIGLPSLHTDSSPRFLSPVRYEVLVLVNAVKQLFAFGFSYNVVSWVTLDGLDGAFGAMAGIQAALMMLGLPL